MGVRTAVRGQYIWAYHSWQYRHTCTPWPMKRHTHMMMLQTGLCRLSVMVKLNAAKRRWERGFVNGLSVLSLYLLLYWESRRSIKGQRHAERRNQNIEWESYKNRLFTVFLWIIEEFNSKVWRHTLQSKSRLHIFNKLWIGISNTVLLSAVIM